MIEVLSQPQKQQSPKQKSTKRIGFAEYRTAQDKIYFNQMLDCDVKQVFSSIKWKVCTNFIQYVLDDNKWYTLNMKQNMKPLLRIHPHVCQFNTNENTQIIKQIGHLAFPSLIDIRLGSNKIESLEALQQIQFPKLKIIWIDYNNFVSIKPLRKLKAPNLKTINSTHNKVKQLNWLSQLKSQKLERMFFDWKMATTIQDQNNQWIYKLQSSKITHLALFCRKRILKSKSQNQKLRDKFVSITSLLQENPQA